MTSEEIRNVTFERSKKGYRAEDVDDFLLLVAREMDGLAAEKDAAIGALAANENKMLILAQKVEEYRGQEETLKTALINAQRMGETVVHEAKQKADAMLRDATGKAELLRQKAERETEIEQRTLERLRNEVGKFRSTILNLYKQHIESLSALDEPVERVDAFLNESPSKAQEAPASEEFKDAVEEAKITGAAEPELPKKSARPTNTGKMPAAGKKTSLNGNTGSLPKPEPTSAMNLFEGIPIDQD